MKCNHKYESEQCLDCLEESRGDRLGYVDNQQDIDEINATYDKHRKELISAYFPQPCSDCEGSKTTIINNLGLHKQREHTCGCRDWAYMEQKTVWYRLKWCSYHHTERLAQFKELQKIESALGGS